ncbi:guanylate kinase [Bemisia tabaci]|nr:PREDICTED: guanylate kinase [Bemisia tabaci]
MVRHGPKVLVMCGPSGSGKSTLLRRLFDDYPDKFGFSVSHTSRSPRPGEIDGKHYHFTDRKEMENAIARGEFLESAVFSNNLYGTSLAAVESVWKSGKICVLDIDMQGVKQVKQRSNMMDPILVFIKPPSLKELEDRLRKRGTETEDSLQRRLAVAQEEIEYGDTPGNFHLVIINDNLEKSYAKLRDFVLAELVKNG